MTTTISNFNLNTSLSTLPKGDGTRDILITLSGEKAGRREETQALLKALGLSEADVAAFNKKHGTDLKKFIEDNSSARRVGLPDAAKDKPGFQAKIRLSERNYDLLTKFAATRRAAEKPAQIFSPPLQTGQGNSATAAQVKNGINPEPAKRAELNKLVDLAEIEKTKFGVPAKLDDVKHFSVKIPAGTKPADRDKILQAFIDKTFGGTIPFAKNRADILEIAKKSGADIKNVKITNGAAEFDMTLESRLKLQIAHNFIKDGINSAEAAADQAVNKNAFSQFVLGLFEGARSSIEGSVGAVADPVGTAKALWQVVGNPLETFNALSKELENTWADFKNAAPEEKSRMIGKLVGSVVTDILIGKGLGAAADILGETRVGATLIKRAETMKAATIAKVAETFSDEAARAASRRIKQALANPALYSGFAGGDLVKDFTVFAGNKLKNGAMSFNQFVKLSVEEYGSNIKGKVDELATAYREAMQKTGFGDKIIELDIEKTSKITKSQFIRESDKAQQQLLNQIQEAENNGILQKVKDKNVDDYDWIVEDQRHKELAFDPDKTQFKMDEAKTVLEAEKQGVIESPVKRGIFDDGSTRGADYIDANGIEWDVKRADGGARKIIETLEGGENVIVDARGMSEADFKALKAEVEANRPISNNQVRYVR